MIFATNEIICGNCYGNLSDSLVQLFLSLARLVGVDGTGVKWDRKLVWRNGLFFSIGRETYSTICPIDKYLVFFRVAVMPGFLHTHGSQLQVLALVILNTATAGVSTWWPAGWMCRVQATPTPGPQRQKNVTIHHDTTRDANEFDTHALLQSDRCTEEVNRLLTQTVMQKVERDGILATRLCTHKDDVEFTNSMQLQQLSGKNQAATPSEIQ